MLCHTGGLENAIPNALAIGGTCFALFIKNQRQWVAKPLEEATVEKFRGKFGFCPKKPSAITYICNFVYRSVQK